MEVLQGTGRRDEQASPSRQTHHTHAHTHTHTHEGNGSELRRQDALNSHQVNCNHSSPFLDTCFELALAKLLPTLSQTIPGLPRRHVGTGSIIWVTAEEDREALQRLQHQFRWSWSMNPVPHQSHNPIFLQLASGIFQKKPFHQAPVSFRRSWGCWQTGESTRGKGKYLTAFKPEP